jgi:hypothetical protein
MLNTVEVFAKALSLTTVFDHEFKTWEFGQITLTAPDENERCWVVGEVTIVPGIRYRKDGSGEPDSADWEEISRHVTLRAALTAVGYLVIEAAVDVAIDQEPVMETSRLDDLGAV